MAAFFFGLSHPRASFSIENCNTGLRTLYQEQLEANPEIKEEEREVWLGFFQNETATITYVTNGLIESKNRMFNVLLFGGLLTIIVALTIPSKREQGGAGQPHLRRRKSENHQ